MINLIYFSFFLFIWSFETKRFSLYYIQFYFDSAILCIGFWVWNWHFPFFKKLYGLAMETESHLFNPRHLTYTKNIRKICHIITPGHRKTLRVHSEISKKTAFGVLWPYATGCQCSQVSDQWSMISCENAMSRASVWELNPLPSNWQSTPVLKPAELWRLFSLWASRGFRAQFPARNSESLEIGLLKYFQYFQLIDWCLTNKQTNQSIN